MAATVDGVGTGGCRAGVASRRTLASMALTQALVAREAGNVINGAGTLHAVKITVFLKTWPCSCGVSHIGIAPTQRDTPRSRARDEGSRRTLGWRTGSLRQPAMSTEVQPRTHTHVAPPSGASLAACAASVTHPACTAMSKPRTPNGAGALRAEGADGGGVGKPGVDGGPRRGDWR
jgi:hypothetical protein